MNECADFVANGVACVNRSVGFVQVPIPGTLFADPRVERAHRTDRCHGRIVDLFDRVTQFVTNRPHQIPVDLVGGHVNEHEPVRAPHRHVH